MRTLQCFKSFNFKPFFTTLPLTTLGLVAFAFRDSVLNEEEPVIIKKYPKKIYKTDLIGKTFPYFKPYKKSYTDSEKLNLISTLSHIEYSIPSTIFYIY